MNLANKLTLLRVVIVPFFVLFMCMGAVPLNYFWALVLFGAASFTDMFDGKIARKYDMVTDFGKFLDPLADKVLVAAALVCFTELGWTSSWVTIVILVREFSVSGVRLIAAGSDKKAVIPANMWGKVKTAATMGGIAVILAMRIFSDNIGLIPELPVKIIGDVLMYIAALLTLISGIKYLYDYREYINPNK